MSNKTIEEVLYRIDFTVDSFQDSVDAVTFPLSYTKSNEWGWGIRCAKGLWVAECDPNIAEEVLVEFDKRNKD